MKQQIIATILLLAALTGIVAGTTTGTVDPTGPKSDEYLRKDATPPVITIINPPNETFLPAGTTWTWINISTDEDATCRYDLTNPAFNYTTDGTDFTSTGGLTHSFNRSYLLNGNTYTLYYRCMDNSGNINTDSMMHRFSILPTPPLLRLWSRYYSTGFKILVDIAIDSDDNVIRTGFDLFGGVDTIKYDSNGTVIWINHSESLYQSSGVVVDSSDCVIVGADNLYNLYIIKYLPNGTNNWTKIYDSGETESSKSIACDGEDNIIVLGAVYAGIPGKANWLIVKYDRDGALLWNRTFVSPGDFPEDVFVDSDNNIIAAGYSSWNKNSGCNMTILKYNPDGNFLYQKTYNSGKSDYAHSVCVDRDDNIIVAGASKRDESTTKTYPCLRKYSSDGTLIWHVGEMSVEDGTYEVVTITNNDRILAGGGELIVCYDASGDKLWEFVYNPTATRDPVCGLSVDSHNNVAVGSAYDYLTEKYGYSHISIGDAEVGLGQEVTIPVMLYNSPGIANVGVKLSYNASVVNVTNITQGDFTSFFDFDDTNRDDGWVSINTHVAGQDLIGELVVANVTLKAVGSSGSSPFHLEILASSDMYGNRVLAGTDDGTFRVSICGDVDLNMTVDAADLQLLLAHIFTRAQVANECVCDVDGSGGVNILDARLLINHLADQEAYPLRCTG
jgi:hypothetical protein